jgi:hypothetical protein
MESFVLYNIISKSDYQRQKTVEGTLAIRQRALISVEIILGNGKHLPRPISEKSEGFGLQLKLSRDAETGKT